MSVRHTVVPAYHSQVELVAFPFASEAALKLGTTALHRNLRDPYLQEQTGRLWRAAEAQLIGESPALSLDELSAMRDRAWFEHSEEATADAVSLVALLRSVSARYLTAEGPTARPARADIEKDEQNDSVVARSVWRWMSFALPPDLLLAGHPGPSPPTEIVALSPRLVAHLERNGFAETHVHKGAAMSFGALWASALSAIADAGFKQDSLKSPGGACNEGRDLASWLLRAAISRYVLARFLMNSHSKLQDALEDLRGDLAQRRGRTTVTAVFDQALEDLCRGELSLGREGPSFASLQSLYADLTSVRTLGWGRPCDAEMPGPLELEKQAFQLDPLFRLVPPFDAAPSPEVWLVRAGLRYLEQARASSDQLFERLFWQTIRVRCLVYRHVVQRPMTPGLQWFVRVYERLKPLRKGFRRDHRPLETAVALAVGGLGKGLQSIELRVAPDVTVQGVLAAAHKDEGFYPKTRPLRAAGAVKETRERRDGRRDASPTQIQRADQDQGRDGVGLPRVGYILHFIRNRGTLDKGTHPAHWAGCIGDPSYDPKEPKKGNASGYRYATYYGARRREALVVARTLTSFPGILESIRGIDLCTDEVGVPTWVLAPLVRYVCQASSAAASALRSYRDSPPSPFGRAVHAGEDFVHLLSGMRRLDEAINHLRLGEGDRIGHGLALGLEPRMWAKNAGRIAMPREERLFDLVWAWSWMTQGRVSSQASVMVEEEIRRLSGEMFEEREGIDAAKMGRLVARLYDEEELKRAGFPFGPSRLPRRPEDDLFLKFLTDNAVYANGMRTVWVDAAKEVDVIDEIQREMRRDVSRKDITVEVNPTSNLLIGHIPDLRNHPLWRLSPGPHSASQDLAPLSLCIGSDDPLTFATTLPEEYQLLHDALVQDGASSTQAMEWLDRVRETGLERSFTCKRSGESLFESIPVRTYVELPP